MPEAAVVEPRRRRLPRWLRFGPKQGLALVLFVAAVTRSFWLDTPHRALIFDEKYYVNAVRILLGWHVAPNDPYAGGPSGIDPNHEHPPLAKLLIAGSMRVFGDNALGWRLVSLASGIAAIYLVYLIVRAAGADEWIGVLAAAVFAFDNLSLVHGRIATLDMPCVAFLLLGAWFWMRGWRLRAGAACALATLCKLVGVYGFAALVLLEAGRLAYGWYRSRTWNRSHLEGAFSLILGFLFVGFFGLWALDLAITPYNTPWEHIRFMLHYGFSLERPRGPANDESTPWQWLYNEVQMHYLKVTEDVSVNGQVTETRPVIDFRGAMNPIVIGTAPLALGYSAWRAWRFRDRLSLWVVSWFALTYGTFIPLWLLSHRTSYIFYFLPALPAVAVATGQLLRQSALPRAASWAYLVGLAVGFAGYYPFRRIL